MDEIRIEQQMDHYAAYAAGGFLCTADSFTEALNEARAYIQGKEGPYVCKN